MQASRGAHPYRQQGHSIATASSAPGGLEGVNMTMLSQLADLGGEDAALILNQLLAKIEALELENKALKAKIERFEGIQASRIPATGLARNQPSRIWGHDAMDLDNYELSPTDRSFPKPHDYPPVPAPARQATPPKDTKGKGSLTRGHVGDLDLAIDDDGQRIIMYIPTSCFAALVEPDVDDLRKLGEFREDSGAKIIIAPCTKRPGSQSPSRKNTAKVVITGTQDQRNIAAMLVADYRVAFLAGQAFLSPPKSKENVNIFRSGSHLTAPNGERRTHWR